MSWIPIHNEITIWVLFMDVKWKIPGIPVIIAVIILLLAIFAAIDPMVIPTAVFLLYNSSWIIVTVLLGTGHR
jgi:hypothetical protein